MARPEPLERPNIIWVFGDQHRAQALGTNGDPNVHTPNVDRMAGHGVNFARAVAGFPLCCPFRGSLLTGRYPHECVPGHEHPMPEGQPTLAAPLKEAGDLVHPVGDGEEIDHLVGEGQLHREVDPFEMGLQLLHPVEPDSRAKIHSIT